MDESTEWSTTDKALYVAVVPLLALTAVLMLFAVATSGSRHASAASAPAKVDMSVSAVRERARKEVLEERKKMYYDCLESMGVRVTGYARWLSRPPSREKIRIAAGVCSALMQYASGHAPPARSHTPGPNTL